MNFGAKKLINQNEELEELLLKSFLYNLTVLSLLFKMLIIDENLVLLRHIKNFIAWANVISASRGLRVGLYKENFKVFLVTTIGIRYATKLKLLFFPLY